ncbi:MAG: hypothetical protein Fues2KO_40670 [Fuerstiella sp.]
MAVVTQPFDRGAMCAAPGKPNEELGEFWEDDPWEIAFKHNLSAYERNRTYLNIGGQKFVDVSEVTSADIDGDSRAATAVDYDNDGDPDLFVRQSGGDPLVLFRNDFPPAGFLKVSLRGTDSNSAGIGARVTAEFDGRTLTRELYPVNSFHSQTMPNVHFGLGESAGVKRLLIHWPSGRQQEVLNVTGKQHILVTEGKSQFHAVQPGQPLP